MHLGQAESKCEGIAEILAFLRAAIGRRMMQQPINLARFVIVYISSYLRT